jgi:hypothetical protein
MTVRGDRGTSNSPALKRRMTGVLLVGLHAAVREIEAEPGERARRELVHHRSCGRQSDFSESSTSG